jgi:cytochrome c oxidase assembly factor CtaG
MDPILEILIIATVVLAIFWAAGCRRCSRKKDASSAGGGFGFLGGNDANAGQSQPPHHGQHHDSGSVGQHMADLTVADITAAVLMAVPVVDTAGIKSRTV